MAFPVNVQIIIPVTTYLQIKQKCSLSKCMNVRKAHARVRFKGFRHYRAKALLIESLPPTRARNWNLVWVKYLCNVLYIC